VAAQAPPYPATDMSADRLLAAQRGAGGARWLSMVRSLATAFAGHVSSRSGW